MTIKITRSMRREQLQLAINLPLTKDALRRAGLFKTMHAMDAAVKKIGYEIAEQMEAESKKAKRHDLPRR